MSMNRIDERFLFDSLGLSLQLIWIVICYFCGEIFIVWNTVNALRYLNFYVFYMRMANKSLFHYLVYFRDNAD